MSESAKRAPLVPVPPPSGVSAVALPRKRVGSPGPWNMHVTYEGNGETRYQVRAADGEPVFTISDRDYVTPGKAAQNAAILFLLIQDHFGDGTLDGVHAKRVETICASLDWALPKHTRRKPKK